MFTTILIMILILSILVLVHELGHFLAAKKVGIRVEEFGLGLPPRLFSKKIGETRYSFNWLPFGGFVKLTGEDFDEATNTSDPRSFASKSPLQRAFVLVAGVFMNIMLAALLYYVIFLSNNFKALTLPLFTDYNFRFGQSEIVRTVVIFTEEDSPALESGIKVGEAILEINGVPVYTISEVRRELSDKIGQEVSLLLMDVQHVDRPLRVLTAVPIANAEGSGKLGILISDAVTLSYGGSTSQKLFSGFAHSYNILAYSTRVLSDLVNFAVETKDIAPISQSVAGPVGIFGAIDKIKTYSGKQAFLSLIDLTAVFSVSLAFLNILPFPALDGGRLFFIMIEKVFSKFGKKINKGLEGSIHKWGMLALLFLLVLVTIKDIKNVIG